jgi:hypothetical protein
MFGDAIVSEPEARELVAWILSLDAKPKAADAPGAGRRAPAVR